MHGITSKQQSIKVIIMNYQSVRDSKYQLNMIIHCDTYCVSDVKEIIQFFFFVNPLNTGFAYTLQYTFSITRDRNAFLIL